MTGRILDAQAGAAGLTTPVVGAVVGFVGTGMTDTTDASGNFTLPNSAFGVAVFSIDGGAATPAANGRIYTDFVKALEVPPGSEPFDFGTFYSTQRTTFTTTVVPGAVTRVTNPDIDALVPGSTTELVVAPSTAVLEGTTTPYTGELSISIVPNCCTPRTMPQFVLAANPLIVTIQPLGIEFTTPAPLSLPNTLGYAPGATVDLWSLNPQLGVFEIKGAGQVSADGTTIATISGGIVATDWHFFVPNPPPAGQPGSTFTSSFIVVPANRPVAVDVSDGFFDPDGDRLVFTLDDTDYPGSLILALTGIILGPPLSNGQEVMVPVTASDGGLSITRTFRIVGTNLPIYAGPSSFPVPPAQPIVIDFGELYSDPLGGVLSFDFVNGGEGPPQPSAAIDPVTGLFTVDPIGTSFYDFEIIATNSAGSTQTYLFIENFET